MQQQSCTFVHCDCAAFEATAIELFTIEANYVAMENFYATEMGKNPFFSLRAKNRRLNFNYERDEFVANIPESFQ